MTLSRLTVKPRKATTSTSKERILPITIVGAGLAGLLAANMLRRHNPVVLEAQPSLPHNHSAVLRFRSSAVGDALGIEFKRVTMVRDVVSTGNLVRDAHLYSEKAGGIIRTDRSIVRGREVAERWIAPPDLIPRMAQGVDIRYSQEWRPEEGSPRVISTIPMPVMADLIGYPRPLAFSGRVGYNLVATVSKCESYCSLLVPDPEHEFSRVSITGDELIVEMARGEEPSLGEAMEAVGQACLLLGIPPRRASGISVRRQEYAKIVPIEERERQLFMHHLNGVRGIAYSLGRFACWRPGLLADDLVADVRTIERWIRAGDASGFDQDLRLAAKTRG